MSLLAYRAAQDMLTASRLLDELTPTCLVFSISNHTFCDRRHWRRKTSVPPTRAEQCFPVIDVYTHTSKDRGIMCPCRQTNT
jgi:hypothetical protein